MEIREEERGNKVWVMKTTASQIFKRSSNEGQVLDSPRKQIKGIS